MNGVKDGTCCEQSPPAQAGWMMLLLTGLILSNVLTVGCQSMPTFRAQSPSWEEDSASVSTEKPGRRQPRRIDDDAMPGEELVPSNIDEGLPISDDADDLSDPITEIVIEGNDTIETSAIRKLIRSAVGRPPVAQQVREDVRALFSTRWFFTVEPRYRRNESNLVLVFRVIERPMVDSVEYKGNERIKSSHLEKLTGLRSGSPFDVSVNREALRRIEEHYKSKGFPYTKVTLAKGNQRQDRDVVFQIDEGPKVIVGRVIFEGNDSFFDGELKKNLTLKPAFLGLPFLGKYKPEQIPDDLAALKQYYHSLGYFDAEIEKEIAIDESPWNPLSYKAAHAVITYKIKEGPRFRIRNLVIEGNEIFSTDELATNLKLRTGDTYSARLMNKDVEILKERYGTLGRTFAKVDPIPRFLEEPGTMDLVYKIDEDRVYTVGKIHVHIQGDHPHTKESVVRNRLLVHPGDLADPKQIQKSVARLKGQIFERQGAEAPRVQLTKVEPRSQPSPSRVMQTGNSIRGQSPDTSSQVRSQSPDLVSEPSPYMLAQSDPATAPFGGAATDPLIYAPPPAVLEPHFYSTETQTGRLSFGVGVNSNSGVVGTFVLEENNFDITRLPSSFEDIRNGTAFRGGGQQFRLEAVPGNVVSRYLLSWTDPYFMDTDYTVGVSGFYFNRFYRDWRENRLGGRVNVGRQLTQEFSVLGSVRMESVDIQNPRTPTPSILQDAVGKNFLSTGRISVAHDTRDSQFLPAEGHYLVGGYEQAFGEFVYPRFDAEAHQYITTYSRPDGGGRHILSLGLQAAWTGPDTPIFENYFAGGFQSFRGFSYRGVGPLDQNVRTGGRWMFLGGAEYMVPITADQMLAAVAFTDFGTIESSKVSFNDFRLSVGGGLRITVPMMGPAPIALDWAFPILKQDFDDRRLFSFSVGYAR